MLEKNTNLMGDYIILDFGGEEEFVGI